MAMSVDNFVKSPEGTKFWILDFGYLEADEAWFLRGANTSTRSNPHPTSKRRLLRQYGVLIDHPEEGLILWETGGGKDYPETAGAPVNDVFAQVDYRPDYDLSTQIEKTGNKIQDVKMIVIGHLHLDHAGGLKELLGSELSKIPIIVHELELKNALYSLATGFDLGVYMEYYLKFDLNWQPWRGSTLDIAQGVTLRHMPGHTPGLAIMQVSLPKETFIFTSDMYLVKENYHDNHAQGFLSRDHDAWCASNQAIHQLVRRTKAHILFGHCNDTLADFKFAPEFYS